MSVSVAGIEIGPGQPCRVVAEVSNNHNGSLDLAKRLIRECAEAGADFVKFQCYTPDELVRLRGDGPAPDPWGSQGWSMRDLYAKAQTPHAWFPELVAECKRVGVAWFSSVFGPTSLDLLLGLGCPALKIAALDVETVRLQLRALDGGDVGIPIIASSRGERIPWADLTLYCPPGYPQRAIWLNRFQLLGLDGFSYHGTDVKAPRAMAALGAHMVEVHVQLDDVPSELEANVSLTVSQLRLLCDGAPWVGVR